MRSRSRSERRHKVPLAYRVSGDDSALHYVPDDQGEISFARLPNDRLKLLAHANDLSSTVSDVLDDLGWNLAISGDRLKARLPATAGVAGHVITLRYLPERTQLMTGKGSGRSIKMAHNLLFQLAHPGDIVVIDAVGLDEISMMGANAARAAQRAGVQAALVDGCVRDLEAIQALGFPVWSRGITPRTGKFRIHASSINRPVLCGGVQVMPGDIAVADETGICFIPLEIAQRVIDRVLEVSPPGVPT